MPSADPGSVVARRTSCGSGGSSSSTAGARISLPPWTPGGKAVAKSPRQATPPRSASPRTTKRPSFTRLVQASLEKQQYEGATSFCDTSAWMWSSATLQKGEDLDSVTSSAGPAGGSDSAPPLSQRRQSAPLGGVTRSSTPPRSGGGRVAASSSRSHPVDSHRGPLWSLPASRGSGSEGLESAAAESTREHVDFASRVLGQTRQLSSSCDWPNEEQFMNSWCAWSQAVSDAVEERYAIPEPPRMPTEGVGASIARVVEAAIVATAALARSSCEAGGLRAIAKSLDEELALCKGEVRRLQAALDSLTARSEETERCLKGRCEELRRSADVANAEVHDLKDQITDLRYALEEGGEVREAERRISELDARERQSRREASESKNKISELLSALAMERRLRIDAESQCEDVKCQVALVEADLSQARTESEKSDTTRIELECELRKARAALQRQLRTGTETESEKPCAHCKDSEFQLSMIKSELVEVRSLSDNSDAMRRNEICQLESELREAKRVVELLKAESHHGLDQSCSPCEDLKLQLRLVKSKLEDMKACCEKSETMRQLEISDLECQLQDAKQAGDDLRQQLKHQLDKPCGNCKDAKLQLTQLSFELADVRALAEKADTMRQDEITDLKSELLDAKVALERVRREAATHLDQPCANCEDMKLEVTLLKSELDDVRACVDKSELTRQEEVAALEARWREARVDRPCAKCEVVDVSLKALRSELREVRARAAESDSTHVKNLAAMECQLQEARAHRPCTSCEDMTIQLRTLSSKLMEVRALSDRSDEMHRAEISELESHLEKARVRSPCENCDDSQKHLKMLQLDFREVTARSDKLEALRQKEIAELQLQLQEARADRACAQAHCEDVEIQLKALKSDFTEVRALSERSDATHQRQISELESQLQEARVCPRCSNCEHVESLLKSLRRELSDLQGASGRSEMKMHELECQLQQASAYRHCVDCANAQGHLDILNSELDEVRARAKESEATRYREIAELESALEEANEARRSVQCDELEIQMKALTSELEEVRALSAKWENKVTELDCQLKEARVDSLCPTCEEKDIQVTSLKLNLRDLKGLSDRSDARLKGEVTELKFELQQARADESCPNCGDIEIQLVALKSELCESSNVRCKQEVMDFEAELRQARSDLERAEQTVGQERQKLPCRKCEAVELQLDDLECELIEVRARSEKSEASLRKEVAKLEFELHEAQLDFERRRQVEATKRLEKGCANCECMKLELVALASELKDVKGSIGKADAALELEDGVASVRGADISSPLSGGCEPQSPLRLELNRREPWSRRLECSEDGASPSAGGLESSFSSIASNKASNISPERVIVGDNVDNSRDHCFAISDGMFKGFPIGEPRLESWGNSLNERLLPGRIPQRVVPRCSKLAVVEPEAEDQDDESCEDSAQDDAVVSAKWWQGPSVLLKEGLAPASGDGQARCNFTSTPGGADESCATLAPSGFDWRRSTAEASTTDACSSEASLFSGSRRSSRRGSSALYEGRALPRLSTTTQPSREMVTADTFR